MELGRGLAGRVRFGLVEATEEGSAEEHGANWMGIFEGSGGGVTVHFCVGPGTLGVLYQCLLN